MLLTMRSSLIWFMSPLLIGGFLYLWHISERSSVLTLTMLLWGEISVAAAWYVLPWLSWIIQLSVVGLFLIRLNIFDTRQEHIFFIAIISVLAMITLLIDHVNNITIPVVLVIGVSLLVIVFTISYEFRLQKEYGDEKS